MDNLSQNLSTSASISSPKEQHETWVRSKVLCPKCQFIFDNWDAWDDWMDEIGYHEHYDLAGIQNSAERGCPICELFITTFQAEDSQNVDLITRTPDLKTTIEVRGDKKVSLNYTIVLRSEDFDAIDARSTLRVVPADHDPEDFVGAIAPYTDAPETWDLVKTWFEICQKSHRDCDVHSAKAALPTRLVDVSTTDDGMRLVLTRGMALSTPYLSLSHCWGKKVFTTLMNENLSEFLDGIPQGNLSRTFRDAIIITRRLGFKYIWIDSLCIIQNDPTDWKRESAGMGAVFGNAALNIAASDSPDGDTGCFFTRPHRKVNGWKVKTKGAGRKAKETLWQCVPHHYSWDLTDGKILNSRAWVFQERVLGPKVLHFTATELVWECQTMFATETLPNGMFDSTKNIIGLATEWSLQGDLENVLYEWSSIVVGYSDGKLSFSEDKLVALSGLARLFHKRSNFPQYLAGLWNHELERQLVWYTDKEKPLLRPETYQAPTWSWASINSQSAYAPGVLGAWIDEYNCTSICTIENAHTTIVDNEFGAVSDGFLEIKCRGLAYGSIWPKERPWSRYVSVGPSKELLEFPVYLDMDIKCPSDRLFFLPVIRLEEKVSIGGKSNGGKESLWGLVLEKPDVKKNRYTRFGSFEVTMTSKIARFLEVVQVCSSEKDCDLPEPVGVDPEGASLYSIIIV